MNTVWNEGALVKRMSDSGKTRYIAKITSIGVSRFYGEILWKRQGITFYDEGDSFGAEKRDWILLTPDEIFAFNEL